MATVRLAIPARICVQKIDVEDVRQGARLRFHRNRNGQEGRSVAEQQTYFQKGVRLRAGRPD